MLGRHSANAPPNCSIQNKKIRNSEYYKEKKESLKAKKVRYDFKIELKKEEEDRLESLKMKIASIKKELHLDNKLVPAANARFMETLGNFLLVIKCTSTLREAYIHSESELQIFTLCSSCVEYNSSFIQANFAINMHWNNANTHSLTIFTIDCSLNVGIYKE